MPVLLQYAQVDNEIKLYDIWKKPVDETLELLEWIANQDVCGFNLAFDWFHIAKCYTTLALLDDYSVIPEDHIDQIGVLEEQARFSDFCIKPKAACDIMLHARKTSYQSLMSRNSIKVKRVPTLLAMAVCRELEKRIQLDGIYFAKRKDPDAPQWQIKDIADDPEFKDIVLRFHPSGQLKELAKHALGIEEDFLLRFTDIQPNPHWRPFELGYAPYALASAKPLSYAPLKIDWRRTWPEMIRHFIAHWAHNPLARKYAGDDVVYTRGLWEHFGRPEPGDDDSELACAVAISRWRGFAIDEKAIGELRSAAIKKKGKIPTAPRVAKIYLQEVMDEVEFDISGICEGTKATILEAIAGKEEQGGWDHSKGWLTEEGKPHLAAVRAREILESRRAAKEIELYDKLLRAGRFHASLKVIGTLSSRMSGADGLNPQGIKAKKYVRVCFPLADFDRGFVLSGGDFVSFEVVLAEAIYKDPALRRDLLKVVVCPDCNGKGCKDCKYTGETRQSIHGLFAEELFDTDYDTIMSTKGTSDHYIDGKRGIFSQLYGGNEHTISDRLGVDMEIATKASEGFMDRYPGIRAARQRIQDKFCSMKQLGGIGTAVEWHDPADYMESLLGFRRYFTLENRITKALFDLAADPPKQWRAFKIRVRRRDRSQTGFGACQSALYSAAFQIQAAAMRQAANHEIQSSGAQITKAVQRRVWNLQPHGVHPWVVQTINIHDEIHCVTKPEYVDRIAEVVHETVESFRDKVPLIKIDWVKEERSWADK